MDEILKIISINTLKIYNKVLNQMNLEFWFLIKPVAILQKIFKDKKKKLNTN